MLDTEQNAENTKSQPQHDFSELDGDYTSFKEKYPEQYMSHEMYAFICGVFQSFQENGVQGVCKTIATHSCRNDLENALDPDCQQTTWCVGDFDSHAEFLESNDNDGKPLYDRSEFGYALNRMCDNHDATIGITWDTIESYLNEYCRLGGE